MGGDGFSKGRRLADVLPSDWDRIFHGVKGIKSLGSIRENDRTRVPCVLLDFHRV